MRHEPEALLREMEKVISGKRDVLIRLLTAMLADGHILLDDVPGVGKTTMAVALSRAAGVPCQRVQFTPDILPSDLVGFSMPDTAGHFRYHPGALLKASLVLGDEINRAPSRTQSALLEAMEERQVTVDGQTYPLPRPFWVIATQNSVGTSGTQKLPYAQMDRFMVRLSLGYPDYEAQMTMLRERQGKDPLDRVESVLTGETFLQLQEEVRKVHADDSILDYLIRLTMASREQPGVSVGVSPRGTLFLDHMAKAHAWMEGRDYVNGWDVQEVFRDTCRHRILLKEDTDEEGRTVESCLDECLRRVESPDRHHRLPGMRRK